MKNISWDLVRSFNAVIQYHSLSGAARALGATQPTIGRHIESLEQQLVMSLFIRSREGLKPTQEALDLFQHTEKMSGSYASFLRQASGEQDEVKGTVRLTTSEVMGIEFLPKLLSDFHQLYPQVEVELLISNQVENLLKRDADIALRMTEPTQQAIVVTKVGKSPIGFYAHKTYLENHGVPKTKKDLINHSLIGPDADLQLIKMLIDHTYVDDRRQFNFRTDNQVAQLALLKSGAGICGMQILLAERDSDLIRVIPDELDMHLWLLMHEDLRSSKRVRVLFDFLRDRLRNIFA